MVMVAVLPGFVFESKISKVSLPVARMVADEGCAEIEKPEPEIDTYGLPVRVIVAVALMFCMVYVVA